MRSPDRLPGLRPSRCGSGHERCGARRSLLRGRERSRCSSSTTAITVCLGHSLGMHRRLIHEPRLSALARAALRLSRHTGRHGGAVSGWSACTISATGRSANRPAMIISPIPLASARRLVADALQSRAEAPTGILVWSRGRRRPFYRFVDRTWRRSSSLRRCVPHARRHELADLGHLRAHCRLRHRALAGRLFRPPPRPPALRIEGAAVQGYNVALPASSAWARPGTTTTTPIRASAQMGLDPSETDLGWWCCRARPARPRLEHQDPGRAASPPALEAPRVSRRTAVRLLFVIGVAFLVVRALLNSHFRNTTLLYLAVPFGISVLLSQLTSRSDRPSLGWRYLDHLRDATIVFLATSAFLYEGFVCVLMFMPIYVLGVTIGFAFTFLAERWRGDRRRLGAFVIPPLVAALSLEGVTDRSPPDATRRSAQAPCSRAASRRCRATWRSRSSSPCCPATPRCCPRAALAPTASSRRAESGSVTPSSDRAATSGGIARTRRGAPVAAPPLRVRRSRSSPRGA